MAQIPNPIDSKLRFSDRDRAKLRQPFGQHLAVPVNLFNSEALFIISPEAVVRPALKGREGENSCQCHCESQPLSPGPSPGHAKIKKPM